MKKIFTLALVMSAVAGLWNQSEAQSKKMWDFALGVSDVDRANLDADATNWNKGSVSEDGVTSYWSDLTKLSGTITANGVPLEYLQDLTVSTTGLKTNNNFKVGPSAFRMTRNNMELHLPKLANGQTITVLARSANGSATDRGIKGNDNMTYKSGPEGGICLGNQVEGSEGTYTLVWEVTTEETDSVDVALIMITGGIDIQSIMIDNGDEGGGSEIDDINIAYLYDGSYNGAKDGDGNKVGWLANGGLDADPIYAALSTYNVTPIDYNGQTLTSTELNDSLQKFDVVVAGECVSSGNALAKGLLDIVNKVPMLNLKSFMYKKGVWTWGAGVNPSPKATSVTVPEDYLEDPLFSGLDFAEDGSLPLFECEDVTAIYGNLVQAYTADSTSLIADDEVLATAGGSSAIHRHGDKNQYMLIPLSSDNLDKVHGNVYSIIDNAVKILAATKSKVINAATPTISQSAANGETTVTITCGTKGATIYYTLDGTDPTSANTVYAEPFVITQDSTVLKAMAVAHGYYDSKISTATILVKTQAEIPTLTIEGSEGFTTLTLTPAEGTTAYFSFNGVSEVATSEAYTEPIVLFEPATITYFAASATSLPSEIASEEITVGGIPAVKDTVAHFTANEDDWFTNAVIKNYALEDQELPTSNWAAKAAYYWGKSAWNYYSDEVDHTEVVYEEDGVTPMKGVDGNDSIKTVYKVNPEAAKYVYSNTDSQWRMVSMGQVLTGETNVTATFAVGNGNTGYYAENATDLIGTPSKGKVTFGGKTSGDPYTAAVESTVKFTAPFDVVTYLTNGGTGTPVLCLETSKDGENWQAVDTLTNATTQRYFKKDRFHVDGTDELYVRVAQTAGSTKAQLYDIYVITTEGMTGIETINEDRDEKGVAKCFDLFGRQLSAPVRGQMYIQDGKKMIVR